jgi:eukaryotic-like serine/threonine-protein kinase
LDEVTEQRTTNPAGGLPTALTMERTEVIPGYVLEEKIGAGGYGEVWRTKAPGGLLKAVKIVFGTLSEARAARELKSLERIKTVRHPFILTLERIEIVEGRLLVVTELAEKSLRDHFNECRAENGVGIPRANLLQFVHDTADALDYMFDRHSLQHLDIKPENLLLLGDHVKVADFGLTKDLRDNSISVVAGLTPLYAAPEVFEGKPSQHSDQYSLAVVYQTLLTGHPPFMGRTAAQLIAQHLHSPPDLSPLPASDQSVIARALSKNAKRRFDTCREFVDALIAAGDRSSESPARVEKAKSTRTRDLSRRESEKVDLSQAVLSPLPPVPLDDVVPQSRATLVVGIGGLAGRVLRALNGRLRETYGDEPSPAFRYIYLDTDEREVLDVLYGGDSEGMGRDAALAIPLKPPASYRKNFRNLIQWISRRWLFNIPRSRQTEGVRALGRLAFVDHYKEIVDRFRKVLTEISSNEAVEQTQNATGLECDRETPRVLVVASTIGGTGSGAVVDVCYALRELLSRLDLRDNGMTAFLLNGIPVASSKKSLCGGNSIACLRELDFFLRSEQYPGDDSAGIQPQEFTPPFPNAYSVNLGGSLGTDGFRQAAEDVADYLHHTLTAPEAPLFDHMRLQPRESRVVSAVRSFSTARVPFGPPKPPRAGDAPAAGVYSLNAVGLNGERPDVLNAVDAARSRLFKTRGGSRLFLCNPGGLSDDVADAVQERSGNNVTSIDYDDGRGPFICFEVEDVPLCDIESRLQDLCPEGLDLAPRLHTRIDVEWE